MRNLKRALSLALASVMLLGMMVVGTSAASINDFTDVDEINNKEAVAIATGLGIFDGYTDGSFGPEKAVTRAEAAVVIAKILHGSDVNPANLAGAGKFTDVPAWAEGYVNLVAAMNIIAGRGEGIFDPSATVTTVEYTTMLLKALGYYVDAETALDSDWKLEVTSKANALGLYGDLELGMNAPLSREDVAALTFNALFAQRVAYNDYRGQYVKATDRDVVVTNGTKDDLNTLADNTFGLYSVEGIVTANGMTDEALSESLKSDAQTTVVFTEDTDLNKDGKVEYTEGDEYDFEVETGLDMIGHAATVYYTIEKKAPVVFAIVDEATLVEYVTYDSNTTKLAKAANDLGFKKNTILDIEVDNYILNYDIDTTVKAAADAKLFDKKDLDTLIVISNSSNNEVDYVIALDQYLDVVAAVDEDDDEIEYELEVADALDMMIATEAVAEGDFVITTDIGNQGDIVVFQPAEVVAADITKITGISDSTATVKRVTADGVDYTKSTVESKVDAKVFELFADIATIGDATLVLDQFGKLIGLAEEAAAPNYAYVAQYGVRHSTGSLNTKNVLTAHVYFADGTDGVYEVDVNNSDAMFKGVDLTKDTEIDQLNTRNWASNNEGAQGLNNGDDNKNGLGIWNVTVGSNNKVKITSLVKNDTKYVSPATKNEVTMVPGHSTLLTKDGTIAKQYNLTSAAWGDIDNDKTADQVTLYNNNSTVYFYVNGNYDEGLTVKVITGIKNVLKVVNDTAATFDFNEDKDSNDDGEKGAGINQAFATLNDDGRGIIDTMLIENVKAGDATDMYYYNQGNYYVVKADGGYTVTYKLYDATTGEAIEVTYDNEGNYFSSVSKAKTHAESKADGFYVLGATDLVGKVVDDDNTKGEADKLDNVTYIVNADAEYDEFAENMYDSITGVGSITETTEVIDICGSGLDTIRKIVKAIETNAGSVTIAYSFDKNYKTDILFVTSYTPDGTDAPGSNKPASTDVKTVEAWSDGGFKVTIEDAAERDTTYTVELWTWSQAQAKWALQSEKDVKIVKGATSATDTVKFVLTQGETYKMIVDGVESNEVQG